jgi:hypothetical protein
MISNQRLGLLIDLFKVISSMAVPYIALLKTRTDLDRFIAAQRAKDLGTTAESQIRRRWFHCMFRVRRCSVAPPRAGECAPVSPVEDTRLATRQDRSDVP